MSGPAARFATTSAVLVALALSCAPPATTTPPTPHTPRAVCSLAELDELAQRFAVPRPILLAMAYTDSRLHASPARLERQTCIRSRFALDAGRAARERQEDAVSAFAELARVAGVATGDSLERWRRVLERWAAYGDAAAAALYADQVLLLAHDGFRADDDDGRTVIVAGVGDDIAPYRVQAERGAGFVGDPQALYLPGSARGHRAAARPRKVRYIVVHTTENTLPVILNYLRNPRCVVGAHYLVRANDGLVIQLADERLVAYHDACFNDDSIGIEHEGYVDDGGHWFSDAMYRASAALVRRIARRYRIPLDRQHILGHGDTPDCSDHSDPGTHWDWTRYMQYVQGD